MASESSEFSDLLPRAAGGDQEALRTLFSPSTDARAAGGQPSCPMPGVKPSQRASQKNFGLLAPLGCQRSMNK
jgi:hypothetical protein